MTHSPNRSIAPQRKLAEYFSQRPRDAATILRRGSGFIFLWVCLIGFGSADIAVGIVAAAAAAWTSLSLWESGAGCASMSIPGYAIRFVRQSIDAGLEVARYAFAREVELRPGFATHQTRVPPGMRREALCTIMSLQPGKLPVGITVDGAIRVHCLDMRKPLVSEMSDDEASFIQVLKPELSHG